MQEERLHNRYQIVSQIGEGAFGVTYIAQVLGEHSQIPRLYAHFASNGKFYLV